MEKGKRTITKYDREYWLTINFYRWEFLRRSKAYRDFYQEVKDDYLNPSKKFRSDLTDKYSSLSEIAHENFGLSWPLMVIHYPKKMLNPNKKIQKDHIVFADYQQYSPFYKDLHFVPHIKRITDLSPSDFKEFRSSNRTHEIFAISTWGAKTISDEEMEVIAGFIRETFAEKQKPLKIKNPFLLAPGEEIRGATLKLKTKTLAGHLEELLKTWDLFQEKMKSERTVENAMFAVADELDIKSDETVRSRIRNARKYIKEASQGRFITPHTDIS